MNSLDDEEYKNEFLSTMIDLIQFFKDMIVLETENDGYVYLRAEQERFNDTKDKLKQFINLSNTKLNIKS